MDEDRIGLLLAKTSELRSKIVSSIQKVPDAEKGGEAEESEASPDAENQEQDDEETESLLRIKDALESLECLLSSSQALLQQQRYEKESALAEIGYSQKKLIKELKEYKGKDLQVIHEATAFAGETDDNNDLLLPPYPSRRPHSVISDNGYLQPFLSTHKSIPNGSTTGGLKNLQESEGKQKESEGKQKQPISRGPIQWVKAFLGAGAKTAVTVVGVVAVLSLAGFEPRLRKRDNNQFKLFDLMKMQGNDGEENVLEFECPPGKVSVIENGEMRCVVKERVEIPFDSVADTPDVSYGCG